MIKLFSVEDKWGTTLAYKIGDVFYLRKFYKNATSSLYSFSTYLEMSLANECRN